MELQVYVICKLGKDIQYLKEPPHQTTANMPCK